MNAEINSKELDVKTGFIDKIMNNMRNDNNHESDAYVYPDAPDGYRKFTMQFHAYGESPASKISLDAKVPDGIEVSVIRNEDNLTDARYRVYAFDRYWDGADLNETMAVAIKDLARDLLIERDKLSKYETMEYDKNLIATAYSKIAVNGVEFSKVSLNELFRKKYEALPPAYKDVEVIHTIRMNLDDITDPETLEFGKYCAYIGCPIAGVQVRKATYSPKEDSEPEEVYIVDTPYGSWRVSDPIDGLLHASYEAILNYLTMHRTIRGLEAENIRLRELVRDNESRVLELKEKYGEE